MEIRLWRMGPVTPLASRLSYSCCPGLEANACLKSTNQQYKFCPLILVCFSRVCRQTINYCAEPSLETTLP